MVNSGPESEYALCELWNVSHFQVLYCTEFRSWHVSTRTWILASILVKLWGISLWHLGVLLVLFTRKEVENIPSTWDPESRFGTNLYLIFSKIDHLLIYWESRKWSIFEKGGISNSVSYLFKKGLSMARILEKLITII